MSNITVPLMGLCDTTIAGHLGSPLYLAAIAVGTMMANVIFWLFGFLRMGTTGLTAKAYGSKNVTETCRIFSRAFYLGIGAGIIILMVSPLLCNLLLFLMSPKEEVRLLAIDYFRIVIFGAPAQLATMAVTGWFIGMQNTTRPMIVAISTNLINIVASLLGVFYFKVGFIGIPTGTLIANWLGLIVAIILALPLSDSRLFRSPISVWKGGGVGRFFKVSTDLFFRSACIMIVSMLVTSIGARLGSDILAANAVIMQFFIFFSYFMDGFAFSGEALCGKAAGAGDLEMFKQTLRGIFFWGLSMTIAMTFIYVFGWDLIAGFITDEEEIINIVSHLKIILMILPAISVAGFLFDGIYIGLTATRQMLIATFLSLMVFVIISIALPQLIKCYGNQTISSLDTDIMLWIGFSAYLLTRGVALASLLKRTSKKFLNI
ncbi:MAG: MATE family efflux transporter [Muribaculaceae bacterium]|nr:MATE family efflux transporter [Muribaculaceae bacterium]